MTASPAKRFAGFGLAAGVAAGLAGPAAAAPLPAAAGQLPVFAPAGDLQPVAYRHRGHGRRYGSGAGAAVALGIIGLGIAAIAAQQNADRQERYYEPQPAYYPPQYDPQYYDGEPVYAPQPYYGPQPVYRHAYPQPVFQQQWRQNRPYFNGYEHRGRAYRDGIPAGSPGNR